MLKNLDTMRFIVRIFTSFSLEIEFLPSLLMFIKFIKKNQDNSDIFKKLIHRLSDMSFQDLEKIDQLLDIIFIPD